MERGRAGVAAADNVSVMAGEVDKPVPGAVMVDSTGPVRGGRRVFGPEGLLGGYGERENGGEKVHGEHPIGRGRGQEEPASAQTVSRHGKAEVIAEVRGIQAAPGECKPIDRSDRYRACARTRRG